MNSTLFGTLLGRRKPAVLAGCERPDSEGFSWYSKMGRTKAGGVWRSTAGSPPRIRTTTARSGARPDTFNHNIETVPRLYPAVRPQAKFARSLEVLRYAKALNPDGLTKSGFMVGLGEVGEEIHATMRALRDHDVDILTIGQYLRPTENHLPMSRYYKPKEFADLKKFGFEFGFRHVESGPLVRSSYHAHEQTSDARQNVLGASV